MLKGNNVVEAFIPMVPVCTYGVLGNHWLWKLTGVCPQCFLISAKAPQKILEDLGVRRF